MSTSRWMAAGEAAHALGVSRATLYAYVSRGLVHSQPLAGATRAHGYAREDVERLAQRTAARRDPAAAAAHALEWGVPVLESAITFIDGRTLFYRGHDAAALARTRSVVEVASLIWTGGFGARIDAAPPAPIGRAPRAGDATFIARAQMALAAAAGADPGAPDLRPASVTRAGWRMLELLTVVAGGRAASREAANEPIDARLARAWRVPAADAAILRAALILCADHELNVSSFTARCVASAGSTPYAVVIAGLSALEGFRHGGAGARVAAMLDAIHAEAVGSRGRSTRQAISRAMAARLRRGEPINSVGHPLYPDGDPRASALLMMLGARGDSPELAFINAIGGAAASLVGEAPNVDFALAGVGRVLRLPPDAPLQLFAIGRTIGWIGQAIEQYATQQLIRPRARYIGPAPKADGA